MTEKEWQQIKRLDISFVVIGSVGSLLITAMIVALSYFGWFDQFTDSGLLSSLDEWLVTVLIGGAIPHSNGLRYSVGAERSAHRARAPQKAARAAG